MKGIKAQIASSLLVCTLAACAPSALPTVSAPPTQTPIRTLALPTATPTPVPDNPTISPTMFDQNNGWGTTDGPYVSRRILRTQDGGLTWKDVTPAEAASVQDGALFILDRQNAWLFSATRSRGTPAIFHTADGGHHWVEYQENLPFKASASLNFVDPNHGTAVGDLDGGAGTFYFRLFQTGDGGQTWKPLLFNDPRGIPAERGFPAGTFHVSSGEGFEFRAPATIWFGGNALVAEKTITLQVSHDAGRSWAKRQINVPESDRVLFDMVQYGLPVFITDRDAYILASYSLPGSSKDKPRDVTAVIMTHDGGDTWAASPSLLDGLGPEPSLQFVSPTDAFVRCGDTLCVTHDSAKTWQSIQANISFAPVGPDQDQVLIGYDFINTTTGWAEIANGLENEMIKTSDGGVTWTKLSPTIRP